LEEAGSLSLDSEAKEYVERIRKSARHLGQLVDDLLNFSRLGRSELSVSGVDLNQVVKDVIAALGPETQGRDVEWKIGELPCVSGDPILLRQVFANLLSNSVKYTRPREKAIIEVNQIPEDGETVIYVRDNGVGFNMKYSGKLFGVFQRLHRADEFEGTGVGLASVDRIIRKHGGRIWSEAEVDKGATFYFTLQARKSSAPLNT
jgi:light-regulated signal transduction histidine kinase (bacteriophytochrome)